MRSISYVTKLIGIGCVAAILGICNRGVADVPPYGGFLEPEPGPYTLVNQIGGPDKYAAFFSGMPRWRKIQLVIDGAPSEAIFSDDDGPDVCDRSITFVYVKLRPQSAHTLEGVPINATSYDRQVAKAPLDCATVELLANVWEAMLSELRYYTGIRGVADGSAYHFSYVASGMLVKSGLTLSPPNDSVAGQFVRLSRQLMVYVDSPAKGREVAKNELVRQARLLLMVARDRNAGVAPPAKRK